MFEAPISLSLIAVLGLLAFSLFAEGAEQYPLGPDSQRQDVPHGVTTHHTWTSLIFPGTVRDYWVYVPAQYTANKPACVMIFQDGGGYVNEEGRMRVPVVFDNLIAKGEMPVTIGLFINPGFLPPVAQGQTGRPNRSFEYDAVSDRYASFLLQELLPEIGKQYNLSQDPDDRALCGTSSGGICAFTAAWFRPDAFRRVLSIVGSFSNLRGGDQYPSLIRKSETKPLRIFLQSGKRDMNTYAGSWYVQNQAMAAAFDYMGYDYQVVLGDEGHNDLQGSSVFPDALRWLWRDYPRPITAPVPPAKREWATDVTVPGQGWEEVAGEYRAWQGLAADPQGNVYVADEATRRLLKLGADGQLSVVREKTSQLSGLAFGPDGSLFACDPAGRLLAFGADGKETVLATGEEGPTALAVDRRGGVYFTDSSRGRTSLWYVAPHGHECLVCEEVGCPTGLRLSPDGSLLMVSDYDERWVYSFQVQPDGSLANGAAFYRLEIADRSSLTGARGLAVDTTGCLYVATELGVQLCDLEGRTALIVANPPGHVVSSLTFGGPDFKTLYALAGSRLYRRPVTRQGGH